MPKKEHNLEMVQDFISHACGDILDICAEFCERFLLPESKEKNASENLRCFLENHEIISSDNTEKIGPRFSDDEYNEAIKKTESITLQIIDNLIARNLSKEEFYLNLSKNIRNQSLFSSKCEMACAVALCLSSIKIPYYQMGEAVQMDNDAYSDASKAIFTSISEMRFILNRGYTQRTEAASQILRVLNGLEDPQKIILLAQLLGYLGRPLEKMKQELDKCQKELRKYKEDDSEKEVLPKPDTHM